MAKQETNKRLTFEISVQYNNRFTIPPLVMKMSGLKKGDKATITLEKIMEA